MADDGSLVCLVLGHVILSETRLWQSLQAQGPFWSGRYLRALITFAASRFDMAHRTKELEKSCWLRGARMYPRTNTSVYPRTHRVSSWLSQQQGG